MSRGISASRRLLPLLFALTLTLGGHAAAEPQAQLEISPDLRELLRAEMQGVASGMQQIVVAISAGEWKRVRDTAEAIRASYIMAKSLTPAQRHQLEQLPQAFQHLDAEFHQRAGRLSEAAAAHDAELTSFHFYRMVDSCTACHARFATKRFPGFAPPEPAGHHHH